MITKEILTQKRDEILKSKATYQIQIAACDGALRVLEDLAALETKEETVDAEAAAS